MDETVSKAKVIISTEGDPSGIEQINAALNAKTAKVREVEAAYEEMYRVASRPPPRVIDNTIPGPKGGFTGGENRGPLNVPVMVDKETARTVGAPANSEAEAAAALRKNSIDSQGLVIAETKMKLLQATIAGDDMEVEKLRGEVAIRSVVLQQMKQAQLSQAELNELTAQEEELLAASAAGIEARAAAETAEAEKAAGNAAEKIYGPRSRAGMLLKNFLDPNMAAAAGIGIFGGLMVKNAIDEWTKSLEKATEQQMKLKDESVKFREEAANLTSVNELEKMRASTLEKINDLRSQASIKDGEEKRQLEEQADMLQGQVAHLDRLVPQVEAREQHERSIKEELRQQEEALDDIKRKYDELQKQDQERLSVEEKIEAIRVGAEIAQVNKREREEIAQVETAGARKKYHQRSRR